MTNLSDLSGVSDQIKNLAATFAPKKLMDAPVDAPDTITRGSFRIASSNIPGLSQELGGIELSRSVSGQSR